MILPLMEEQVIRLAVLKSMQKLACSAMVVYVVAG
jgi:hypothetical protein